MKYRSDGDDAPWGDDRVPKMPSYVTRVICAHTSLVLEDQMRKMHMINVHVFVVARNV